MKKTILIVDDNPADSRLIIEAFKHINERDRFEFSYAHDGEEAINVLNSLINLNLHFNLIILDLNIPRINGKEVLAFIKSNPILSSTPVIVSTNSDYKGDIDACHALNVDAYIQKPENFMDLVAFAESIVFSDIQYDKLIVSEIMNHLYERKQVV
jgi:CheY-like chemotaxis protein